uniref:Small G protein signaling modulator 1 n=1 Tax=Laticauda laticaudata TaxID=8630 RepID=A0A8C5SY22_LATLA
MPQGSNWAVCLIGTWGCPGRRAFLLWNGRKSFVKQIMEEAVTRKFVHEDSSHIISFCTAVEACVLHGLKRRAAGFLRSNKMAALFMKVGKSFPPAEELSRKVQGLEQLIESTRNQGSSLQESARKAPKPPSLSPQAIKHLWIRTALFEKVLDKIVHYLVENSSKYYEKEALLMDPVDGPILASLLVGPCALEYTKMKTADHFWTDPSADELVQRHRIHSSHCRQDSPTKRPALCIQKRHSSGSMDDRPSLSARDYVESLHQNSRATLLYGKNNVLVQPRDDMEAIPGYLSLHQTADVMTLKWTPNQLMNGSVGDLDYEKSVYWDYAMTICLEEIVYLHCHQQDSGGTVVLVSQDGIQRPPLRFPKGGHLLQFLSCLENGLLPHGQLDPPLWSQRGKGKVFPRLKKRNLQGPWEPPLDREEEEATDYVFRILYPGFPSRSLSNENAALGLIGGIQCLLCTLRGDELGSLGGELLAFGGASPAPSGSSVPGLAYCRHLSTVRTHLSALVNHSIVSPEVPCDASSGLTTEIWETFLQDSTSYEEKELLRLVYFGGIQHEIRKSVWPFLLGHYQFGMLEAERKEVDLQTRAHYEQTMAEWLGCEAIVRQREKESHAAALAKCSSGASLDSHVGPPRHRDSTVSSGVSISSGASQRLPAGASPLTALPNGGLPEAGSCSPDSGHPSSQNFSMASAYSERSFSTEESWLEGGKGGAGQASGEGPPPARDSSPLDGKGEEAEGPLDTSVAWLGQELPGKERGALPRELLDLYTVNLHRIEKDVQRCDRNYWYFSPANLEKLRNVMCSYIWHHIEVGYVQGMCDLLALSLAFSCFTELMKRMNQNFPHGGAMDTHGLFRQILDSELFELMHQNGDYTHFYFCYRWFLLDFKRELVYEDVFTVWETIWAASQVSSPGYGLFIALALVEVYRDIILENNMDFTDIIKFFNEMAERHNTKQVLQLARELVSKVQTLIENK